MGRTGDLLKKGRVVIALVVAFALGGGAGGLIEHQRLKDKSNKSASTGSPTTVKPGAAVWFKTPTTAACPALKSWQAAAFASYSANLKATPWATTKAALLAQNTAATTALKKMLPMTTPAGRVGINFLVITEGKMINALKHATTKADYGKAAKVIAIPRVSRSNTIMARAVRACATTT